MTQLLVWGGLVVSQLLGNPRIPYVPATRHTKRTKTYRHYRWSCPAIYYTLTVRINLTLRRVRVTIVAMGSGKYHKF